jgi:hypothetical protein
MLIRPDLFHPPVCPAYEGALVFRNLSQSGQSGPPFRICFFRPTLLQGGSRD